MRYFRRPWDESRGDEHDDWGTSVWLLEVEDDGGVVRQVELYENGQCLTYDGGHVEDAFGGLADQPLDLHDFEDYEIDREDFEGVWTSTKAVNRTR